MSTTDAHIRYYIWLIDSNSTIKPARLSVREAMKRPNESWRKITTKYKVYKECVKQIFRFDENNERTIKKYILKSMRRSWKETRLRLYDAFYEPTFTFEQNIEHRPPGINREHWRKFLEYRAKAEMKKKIEIEQHDESSRVLSQNNSIAQVFGKEKPGRVRGMGFGPTPTQLFGSNSHVPGNGVEVEETQRKLLALQAELDGEKLKRKKMEDEATAEKKKMQAMERDLIYLFQRQGEELPRDIAVETSSVE
ncbi:uncharacterized protein LOC130975518 [Arachis stenosperma]|uniref:uncharacterized protein LOC130975518 n=1 Tax=Arachis stenosperma TaxID=217475 RepID=UPI0025AD8576|nr:uncharacterized protein LOC130975518 [Arachis stenosperma]